MLAIVIPYFKQTFFEKTLQSLANQTNQDFKVYVGDDASPENPQKLLKKFSDKFNLKYHRFDENLGNTALTKHWERSIDLIENEQWIMILGDDDVVDKNLVQEFYNNLDTINTQKINIIRFATIVINEHCQHVSENFNHPVTEFIASSFYRKFKGNSRSSLSEYVFSRTSFNEYHFKNYPLAWHSDDMAWFDFSKNKPIFTINDTVVKIRKTNWSISGDCGNVLLKKTAIQMFFTDLVNNYLHLFSKKQAIEILYSWEQKIKWDRSLSPLEWLYLVKKYIKNGTMLDLIKLMRRIFLAIFIVH